MGSDDALHISKTREMVRLRRRLFTGVIVAAFVSALPGRAVASPDVYTIANYPIEAIAQNAVAAKREAVADGQRAALRSLLKRIVPVTRYAQLRQIKLPDASGFIDSLQVRSERNSSTEYVADVDFRFQKDAVRRLLKANNLPFVDTAAGMTTLLPIYKAPSSAGAAKRTSPAAFRARAGAVTWRDVWSGLDLENALAPVKLAALRTRIHPDTIAMVTSGDGGGQRILQGEYGMQQVVVAEIEPDLSTRRLRMTLAGTDAVGAFRLVRTLRFEPEDFAYGLELAAVIAQGVLDGRWKAVRAARAQNPAAIAAYAPRSDGREGFSTTTTRGDGNRRASAQNSETSGFTSRVPRGRSNGSLLPIEIRFQSLAQWQQIRRVMEDVPGVSGLDVRGLSMQSARVIVDYPRGGPAFADEMRRKGLSLQQFGDRWVLQ
ncbi:MAG: hypothetical protein AAFY64_03360 [Pseudomonadota bacterium]